MGIGLDSSGINKERIMGQDSSGSNKERIRGLAGKK
jgi:hypothetical protein